MRGTSGERRFRYEDQTSGIADALELPTGQPEGAALKETLRSFLKLLGALARRLL